MAINGNTLVRLCHRVRSIGFTDKMDSYEKRRLGLFNIINCIGFFTGIMIPLGAAFGKGYVPPITWAVAIAPCFISGVV
ncbi:MAG TPA: hypothetical protein PKC51_10505, partial [Ferruginibacter sp.]|nr:hypothetical protein [Ferruginibacter sp.]